MKKTVCCAGFVVGDGKKCYDVFMKKDSNSIGNIEGMVAMIY